VPDPGRRAAFRNAALLVSLTILAIALQGYHPGLEDDAYYLAAIRKDLNPALFPHDSDFFQLQFEATIFDKLIAWSIRLTHLPVAWAILIWHFAAIFLILWACHAIAARCFRETHARWAAVALVAALLTLPVSGTGITLVDQYLHPRALATAAILWALVATLERRALLAGCLLALAAAIHVIMASFGISLCLFLAFKRRRKWRASGTVAALLPLGWLFEPSSPAWRQAAATRTFYFLLRWEWYEWLGVVAPIGLLWWFSRIGRRNGSPATEFPAMEFLARRLAWFGIFQLCVALAIMLPPGFERLRPFEPMRYLHLVYLLMILLAGGLAGQYILKRHLYRWVLLFAPLCFGMGFAQREMFPATAHLELPGVPQRNAWVNAFLWVKNNAPRDSLFALDPEYMALPGEDFHGFRALAERSMLADNLKDPGMVARVPRLAGRWLTEVTAQRGWKNFQPEDFERLNTQFGVDWVVLAQPGVAGMKCPYQNRAVLVCTITGAATARP